MHERAKRVRIREERNQQIFFTVSGIVKPLRNVPAVSLETCAADHPDSVLLRRKTCCFNVNIKGVFQRRLERQSLRGRFLNCTGYDLHNGNLPEYESSLA